MISLIEKIRLLAPQEYDQQKLLEFLEQSEKYSEDSEFTTDPGSAREFTDIVNNLGIKYSKQLAGNEPLQQKLKNLETKLRWLDPSSLESNYRKELMSAGLVKALRMGVDVQDSLEKYLFIWENRFQPDEERRKDLVYDLVNNGEIIGADKITLASGESVISSVQNWIKDYLSSLPANSLGGGFEKVNYLTNSANVKKLNPQEREILTQVIDIYRLLKQPQGKFVTAVPDEEFDSQRARRPAVVPPVPKAPIAPAAPIAPRSPVVPAVPPKTQVSEFDKKLAQVSAIPATSSPHGQTLEVLKHKLEERGVDVAPSHGAVQPLPSKVRLTPQEIQREVNTPELPTHQAAPISMAPKPAMAAPKPPAPPAIRPPLTPHNSSLKPISVLDDLKKLDVSFLRQAPLPSQIANLKFAIINIAHGNKVLPYYAVNAFEQSPLFQAYLAHGSSRFAGAGATDNLSQQEFEAIADLRKELERL